MIGGTNAGGISRYAQLIVSTEEESLQDAYVNVTGTNPDTQKVDSQRKKMVNGKVKFRLRYLTDYTIECDSVTATVKVDAFNNYSATISIYRWDGELFAIDDSKPSGEKANQYLDITGGWRNFGTNSSAAAYPAIDDSGMSFRGASSVRSGYITANEIDVTGYSKLVIDADNSTGMTIGLTKGDISSSKTFGDIEATGKLIKNSPASQELSIPEGTTACRVYITSAYDTRVVTVYGIKLVK